MMNSLSTSVLAFDMSSIVCAIGIQHGDQMKESNIIAHKQHAQLILPTIQHFLHELTLTLTDLNVIAFGCGPGSYTGIRLASSVAQGLALALTLPLIPVSSLAAMAQAAYVARGWEHVLVMLDARQEEIYWAYYQYNQASNTMLLQGKEILSHPSQLMVPEAQSYCIIGNAWEKYAQHFDKKIQENLLDVDLNIYPTGSALLAIALDQQKKGVWVSPAEALPQYLR